MEGKKIKKRKQYIRKGGNSAPYASGLKFWYSIIELCGKVYAVQLCTLTSRHGSIRECQTNTEELIKNSTDQTSQQRLI